MLGVLHRDEPCAVVPSRVGVYNVAKLHGWHQQLFLKGTIMSRNKPAAPAPDRAAELQIAANNLNEAIAVEAEAIADRKSRQIEYDKSLSAFNTYCAEVIAATVITFNG